MSSPLKQYKVLANFPTLASPHAFQSTTIEARSWTRAIQLAVAYFRKLPELRRRHITAVSITLQQLTVNRASLRDPDSQLDKQQDIRFGGTLDETGE